MLFQSHSLPRSPQNNNTMSQVTSIDELNFMTGGVVSRVNSTKNSNLRGFANNAVGGKKRKLAINSRQAGSSTTNTASNIKGYALKSQDQTRPLSGNQRI